METEKEEINIGYQTKELCPFTDFCFMNYKRETCRGREHYQHCSFYQNVMMCEIGDLKRGLQERVLSHKLIEEAREKIDMGRVNYLEGLAKEWVNEYLKKEKGEEKIKLQKSLPLLREEVVNP